MDDKDILELLNKTLLAIIKVIEGGKLSGTDRVILTDIGKEVAPAIESLIEELS